MSAGIQPAELHTDRLVLRPLQLSDAPQTQRLFPQWEIVKYLNSIVPWPYPADGAITYYRDVVFPAVERGDEWHWTLRLKKSPDQHIGSIGLMKGKPDNRGFWLGLPWHGQGLMTEAVIAANDFWFDVLGFERPAHSEGSRQPRIEAHLREDWYAHGRHRRAGLCLRQVPLRNLGAHRRRMAQSESAPSRQTTTLGPPICPPPAMFSHRSRQSSRLSKSASPRPCAAYYAPAPRAHPAPAE